MDRWMAVRPWENRLLDSNTKESMPTHEDKKDEETKPQITPKGKVPTSSTLGQSKKKGVKHKKSYSDVSCTSFARPTNVLPSTSLGSSKQKAKVSDEVFEEVSSQPTEVTYKAVRNPKDKLVQASTPAKKRLSLPNNGKHTIISGYPVFSTIVAHSALKHPMTIIEKILEVLAKSNYDNLDQHANRYVLH